MSTKTYQRIKISEGEINLLNIAALNIPSAGGFYPIQVSYTTEKDTIKKIAEACLNQDFIKDASLVFGLFSDPARTVEKYGMRGYRYICMEAGHSGQNISLVALTLKLGSVMIGAFDDNKIKKVFETTLDPIYVVVVGKEKEKARK